MSKQAAVPAASKAVKRVYVVEEGYAEGTKISFLVRAGSPAQAVHHIVRGRFTAKAASTEDVLRLHDVEVQDAGSEA